MSGRALLLCFFWLWLALALGACARPGPGEPVVIDLDVPERGVELAGYEAHFVLTWNGARMGDASERVRRGAGGLRFERRERVVVRRGDAVVHAETVITIDMDDALVAREVEVWQRSGGVQVRGAARRDAAGDWEVAHGDEPLRRVPGHVVPAELVPLLMAARSVAGYRGDVFLPGHGFAVATLEVTAAAERVRELVLDTAQGRFGGRWWLTRGGVVARAEAHDGTGALRVEPAAVQVEFAPPEIVDAASIEVWPSRAESAESAGVLVLEPVARGVPPRMPGQRIEADGRVWRVHLLAGDRPRIADERDDMDMGERDADMAALARRVVAGVTGADAEVAALVAGVGALLEDDLGVTATSARAALEQGRGDCTAYALVFVALARARGIPARLVTGYRLDGERLIRHRWAMVRVRGAWMAVDPTHGEAPAAPRLLGLAVHDASMADMAMADELAFAGLSGARAWR